MILLLAKICFFVVATSCYFSVRLGCIDAFVGSCLVIFVFKDNIFLPEDTYALTIELFNQCSLLMETYDNRNAKGYIS